MGKRTLDIHHLQQVHDQGIFGAMCTKQNRQHLIPHEEMGNLRKTAYGNYVLTPRGYTALGKTVPNLSPALDAFLNRVRDLLYSEFSSELRSELIPVSRWSGGKEAEFDPVLRVEWETGGMSGGSCWDNNEPTGYTTDNEPLELGSLDYLLGVLIPNLSFLNYKKLRDTVVKSTTHTRYEYYGNSTNYSVRYVRLEDLLQFLTENNLLPAE